MGAPLTLLDPGAGDEESCYIDTPLGVSAVLRSIARAGTRTAAYADDTETFIHTTLLALQGKPPRLLFEPGADKALNTRILAAKELTFVTADHEIPVQFSCRGPSVADHDRLEVFSVLAPERVLRLQRRGFYRLPGQSVEPVTCELTCPGSSRVLQSSVTDLSCGGLSALVAGAHASFQEGTRTACVVEIPGIGNIATEVDVRAAFPIEPPHGPRAWRYGLQFVNLDSRDAAIIQRYILEQQRARKRVSD